MGPRATQEQWLTHQSNARYHRWIDKGLILCWLFRTLHGLPSRGVGRVSRRAGVRTIPCPLQSTTLAKTDWEVIHETPIIYSEFLCVQSTLFLLVKKLLIG